MRVHCVCCTVLWVLTNVECLLSSNIVSYWVVSLPSKIISASFTHPSFRPQLLATTDFFFFFTISTDFYFSEYHLIGVIQYVAFQTAFLHLAMCVCLLCLLWLGSCFYHRLVSFVWMRHSLSIHSPTEGYLGDFQALTVMNKATINIHV